METFIILGSMTHLNDENKVIVHSVDKVKFLTPEQLEDGNLIESFLKDHDSYLIPCEYKGVIEYESNYTIDEEGLPREKGLTDEEEKERRKLVAYHQEVDHGGTWDDWWSIVEFNNVADLAYCREQYQNDQN